MQLSGLPFECLFYLGKILGDRELLRTVTFTAFAVDASGCFGKLCGKRFVDILHFPVFLGISGILIIQGKISGDGNAPGTVWRAIITPGAGNGSAASYDFRRLGQKIQFLPGKGRELCHVVFDLRHMIHPAENGFNVFQRRRKSNCPRGGRTFRRMGLQQCLRVGGKVHQTATLNRLHNQYLFPVPDCSFVTGTGPDGNTVPIQIVDLELNIVHLTVGRENLIQKFRAVVVGKTDCPCKPLFFELLQKGKLAGLFANGVVGGVEPVNQVYIEV